MDTDPVIASIILHCGDRAAIPYTESLSEDTLSEGYTVANAGATVVFPVYTNGTVVMRACGFPRVLVKVAPADPAHDWDAMWVEEPFARDRRWAGYA